MYVYKIENGVWGYPVGRACDYMYVYLVVASRIFNWKLVNMQI